MKLLWQNLGKWRWGAVGSLCAVLAAGGATYGIHSAAAADATQGRTLAAAANRITLVKDCARLGIVVMANQTPITQADAQAILPVLTELRDTKKPMDEATAAAIDAKLQAAFSPAIKQAVGVVRLPQANGTVRERMRQRMQQRAQQQVAPSDETQTTPQGAGGARGMRMQAGLNRLIAFFQKTAQGA